MNAVLRRRFEMAMRVRDFLHAHPTADAAEKPAVARLEELIQRVDALASQQRSSIVARQVSIEQRAGLRGALQTKLLRYLGALGRAAAKQNAELAAEFRVPQKHASNQAFLTMAKGLLGKATVLKDALVGQGMSPTLLDNLAAAIADFEKTLEATRASKLEHVGASADLRAVASEISKLVRVLDGVVRFAYSDNAELMGAWASARDVVGPFKHSQPEPEPGSGGGTVAPAA